MIRTSNAPQSEIRVVLRDQTAIFPSAVRGLIEHLLSPRSALREDGGSGKGRVRFYRKSHRGGVVVRARLVPRLICALEMFGYVVHVAVKREWPYLAIPKPACVQLCGTTLQCEILNAVLESVYGQIAIQSTTSVPRILAGVAKLFPRDQILVVVKNRRAAQRLAVSLAAELDVQMSCNSQPRPKGSRIHVDNMVSCVGRNVEDWTVVVVADDESAVSKTVIDQVTCMSGSRVYGITSANRRFDEEDTLRLETLCGPEIYRQRNDSAELTKVEHCWLPACSYPPVRPRNALERKRDNIWTNQSRNKQIADAARWLRTLDVDGLRSLGLDESKVIQDFLRRETQPSVIVLVEVPEHAQRFHNILPDWNIVSVTNLQSVNADLPISVDQGIVTIGCACEPGITADVIVRAAGTEHAWVKNYGPHCMFNGQYMLVVDLADDFDARAEKDARRRRQEYWERGWSEDVREEMER